MASRMAGTTEHRYHSSRHFCGRGVWVPRVPSGTAAPPNCSTRAGCAPRGASWAHHRAGGGTQRWAAVGQAGGQGVGGRRVALGGFAERPALPQPRGDAQVVANLFPQVLQVPLRVLCAGGGPPRNPWEPIGFLRRNQHFVPPLTPFWPRWRYVRGGPCLSHARATQSRGAGSPSIAL